MLNYLHRTRLNHGVAMQRFYSYVGVSRQGYYQTLKRRRLEHEMMKSITDEVRLYREKKDSRAGSRSLYYNLAISNQFGIGVTKFEQLMSEYGQSLLPLRTKVVTTQSCYQSWNYNNLTNGLIINDVNVLVVGDLTYLNIGKNRYYMFCLTDVYSARVVGCHLGSRMRKEEAIAALKMWLKLRGRGKLKQCIHHTDGGSQYFSEEYLSILNKGEIAISVARSCQENGHAEQKNSVIKNHLISTVQSSSKKGLTQSIKRIMYFYNHERKQESLGWRSPVEFEIYIQGIKDKPELLLHDFKTRQPSRRKGFKRHESTKS